MIENSHAQINYEETNDRSKKVVDPNATMEEIDPKVHPD